MLHHDAAPAAIPPSSVELAPAMHPYRDAPVPGVDAPRSHPEELILYSLLVAIGAIPAAIALIQRTAFGVEATIGLVMICTGGLGGLVYTRRARRARRALRQSR
jgi:hypothetical protein